MGPRTEHPGASVTVNYAEKTPLIQILRDLEERSQTTILVDWANLAGIGIAADVKTTLRANDVALSSALVAALQPLGLSYRILGPQTFEVSTRRALAARMEVEFHSVAGLLAKGHSAATLVERIKAQVAGGTWNDAGGPGVIYFDAPSGHLIVLQSQPAQVNLQILLGEIAKSPAESAQAQPRPARP